MDHLQRFDPPAFMNDLDEIKDGREQWDEFMDFVFKWTLEAEQSTYGDAGQPDAVLQYFNPKAYAGPLIEQPLVWNAFPKAMLLRFGRQKALAEADELIPYFPTNTFRDFPKSQFNLGFDPMNPANQDVIAKATAWTRQLDEYCEWRVERDPSNGRITKITFTSEPPEYWYALFGGKFSLDEKHAFTFRGDPNVATRLYGELLGLPGPVDPNDLRGKQTYEMVEKGGYDPYNKWNTTHGIIHLCCPPNTIGAEVRLGGDATILYKRPNNEVVTNPDELIGRAAYGGQNRNSDPTIGGSVNALARLGAMITLVNPIGLYMDNIDVAGWELPDSIDPRDCCKIVRGRAGMIERLVVEVPKETGRCVGDLMIGGEQVRYGGQIAECITVKLIGGAYNIGAIRNAPIDGLRAPYLRPTEPSEIYYGPTHGRVSGLEAAFAFSQSKLKPNEIHQDQECPVQPSKTAALRAGKV